MSLKFEAFNSSVDTDFWYILEKKKLVEMKLERDVDCFGFYQTGNQFADLSSRFRITRESFFKSEELSVDWYTNASPGSLLITNTKEEFKNIDKKQLLRDTGAKILASVNDKKWLVSPWVLTTFKFLCFGDLKNHKFFYTLCFPVMKFKTDIISQNGLSKSQLKDLSGSYSSYKEKADLSCRSFFCVRKDTMEVTSLKDINENNIKDCIFAFNDSSSKEKFPGTVARNYIYAIQKTFEIQEFPLLAVRQDHGSTEVSEKSILFHIKCPEYLSKKKDDELIWLGWERRVRGKDISSLLDPLKLAESSVNLNLQLMKWRMFPSLDLEKTSQIKCLLVGSGTLGCHVARNLLAWGIFNITFVDRGKVSHSNPVRQPLFEFNDVGKDKAGCAAEHVKRIYPNAISKGCNVDIPMPGHFVTNKESTLENVEKMRKLVEEHDVIFLLTDTRESRWLPTVMACAERKIVINSALGFESYVVMRHGVRKEKDKEEEEEKDESRLGCYFCNDVIAPVDSTKDRTLDQQCTVTRPGVSAIAGSMSVEMLLGLIHHKYGKYASTELEMGGNQEEEEEELSELGGVPHQVRGRLSDYKMFTLTGKNYSQCIACSETVIKKYLDEGNEFLIKCFNNPGVLEEITGLKELYEKTQKRLDDFEVEGEMGGGDDDDDFSFI